MGCCWAYKMLSCIHDSTSTLQGHMRHMLTFLVRTLTGLSYQDPISLFRFMKFINTKFQRTPSPRLWASIDRGGFPQPGTPILILTHWSDRALRHIQRSVPATRFTCHDIVTKILFRSLGWLEDGGGLSLLSGHLHTAPSALSCPWGHDPWGTWRDFDGQSVFNP